MRVIAPIFYVYGACLVFFLVFSFSAKTLDSELIIAANSFLPLQVKSSSNNIFPISAFKLESNFPQESITIRDIPKEDIKVNSIFFSNIEEEIDVYINENIVFNSENTPPNIINRTRPLIITFSSISLLDIEKITFVLNGKSHFRHVSIPYIGNFTNISTNSPFANLWQGDLGYLLLIEILLIIFLFFAYFTFEYESRFMPLLAITIMLFISAIENYYTVYNQISKPHNFSYMPLLFLSIMELKKASSFNTPYVFLKRLWGLIALSCGLLVLIRIALNIEPELNNLFLLTTFIVGLTFYFLASLFTIDPSEKFTAFVCSYLLFCMILLFFDLLNKVGIINFDFYISYLSPYFFLILVAIAFSYLNYFGQKSLANFNQTLSQELALQKNRLQLNHNRNIELIRQRAEAKEREELQLDLHDGVLSYLSVINLITEKKDDEDSIAIGKLSRFATQEIRIILDSPTIDQNSLFLTLSSLRIQIVEPLKLVGVKCTWNLLTLIDYQLYSKSHLLAITRIIQECIHNAVVRSNCKELLVYAVNDSYNNKLIVITNKGGASYNPKDHGIEPTQSKLPLGSKGHGIGNIRKRASQIGASFVIKGIKGGARCVIKLTQAPYI